MNKETRSGFPGALFCFEPLAYSTQRLLTLGAVCSGSEVFIFHLILIDISLTDNSGFVFVS